MDVVYIRSYPSRPQDVDDSSASSGGDAANLRRSWRVSIRINDRDAVSAVMVDPFQEVQYRTVLETYLRSSDRPRWSAQSLTEADDGADEAARAEDLMQEYGESLLSQLGLETGLFGVGTTEAQIYVVEHHDVDPTSKTLGGVHCLAWELLEAVHIAHLPKLRLRVTRVSDFPAPRFLCPARPSPLAAIQADRNAQFKILLVIARDFTRTGAERDPEPDLAQWPLMRLQKKLRGRLLLELVRPGSREDLERHLELRTAQNVEFNLVHFDLHGRIMRDECGTLVPWLLFAKQHVPNGHGYHMPETHLAKAEDIAELLARHRVENVVLNACLSAYNRTGPATNLAHIFLKHGVQNISAMWFYVHWQTVATYLEAFYEKLLVKCVDFHVAAQRGRDAIRDQPTSRTGRAYHDFFLCVNYARSVHRTQSMQRDPSPTSSAMSQGSTASTSNSMKSFRSGKWRPPTPRLGDSLTMGDEPIMRLQLHLLELEYKLTTFRVVYASDLRQAGSDLNATMDRMVNMWLGTNLVDEVLFYKAKDFGKRRILTDNVSPRERRTRHTNGGYLHLLFPRPVRALRQTLHVVREVDPVVDPGLQADDLENRRREERRFLAQEGLQRFARKLHAEEHSYMLFLGSGNAQWWRTYLQHLEGEWWVHKPWGFTVHTRYLQAEGSRLCV
ncbi:TPR repeat-containing protein [Tolypocladium capitatum]|uniref:TPR repeat-containing protein n=1 Tax=Tolypocladium capitatum TaxID=45235 RepID=A0A2K3QM23_9HYPO|nr:TPR repeat-containing protein [Tolypocladium capitatum]